MVLDTTPTQGLTIYLLKEKYTSADAVIKANDQLANHNLNSLGERIGQLFVEQRLPKPPRWARFFRDYIEPRDLGLVSTASAVLFIECSHRLFAVTFGQGRHLLEDDSWEERFGLRVALNSIGESNVRSIEKRKLDAISLHSREQASREASAREFEIDIEQDLLRAITGTPTESDLGRRLFGMDALHAAIPTNLESLRNLLELYYIRYKDDTYKKTFPWVDHIAEIRSKALLNELDDSLISKILANDLERIWMAVPDVLQWERVDGFRYGKGKSYPRLHDINLHGFLKTIPDLSSLTKEILSHRKIYCVDNDGVLIDCWPAYRCIYAEIERGDETFLLSNGKWYRITTDFVREVNEAFRRLPGYKHGLPAYQDASETAYNLRAAESDPSRYALMDRKNIQYGGGKSSQEFCDLFSKQKDIIHVKRYASSSLLSHLFAQGLISGELFYVDPEFREKVNAELPEEYRIEDVNQRPNQNEYQIVFAIISNAAGDLVLPFFSRLNIKNAAKRLVGYGYRVAIAKIDVDQRFSLTSRYD